MLQNCHALHEVFHGIYIHTEGPREGRIINVFTLLLALVTYAVRLDGENIHRDLDLRLRRQNQPDIDPRWFSRQLNPEFHSTINSIPQHLVHLRYRPTTVGYNVYEQHFAKGFLSKDSQISPCGIDDTFEVVSCATSSSPPTPCARCPCP